MKFLIVFCTMVAVAFAQDISGSGSGQEPGVPVTISMNLTTTIDAVYDDVVNDTFDALFCAEIEDEFNSAVVAAGNQASSVICTVLSKVSGSIIVTFDVVINGESNTLSTTDSQAILDALTTSTLLGYPLLNDIGDLNECTSSDLNNCLDFQQCSNTLGSFDCQCAPSKYDENGDASSCVEPISVTCEADRMTITVIQGYLDANGITSEQLRLNDENCSGELVGTNTDIVVNGLASCGTTKSSTTTDITYSNVVSNEAKTTDIIITGATLGATVSCTYPVGVTTSLDPFEGTVGTLDNTNTTANGTFTAQMVAYTDNTFTTETTQTQFTTSETLYIQADLTATDSTLAVGLQDCWATPTADTNDTISYQLIQDMCPVDNAVDGTVAIITSGQTDVAQWTVQVFRFVDDNFNEVYIHCDLEICNDQCTETCTATRRRRSAKSILLSAPLRRERRQAEETNVLEQDRETLGPIFRVEVTSQGLDPLVIVLISVLVFVLLTIFFVLLFVLFRRRREEKDKKSSAAFSSDKHGHVNTGYDY